MTPRSGRLESGHSCSSLGLSIGVNHLIANWIQLVNQTKKRLIELGARNFVHRKTNGIRSRSVPRSNSIWDMSHMTSRFWIPKTQASPKRVRYTQQTPRNRAYKAELLFQSVPWRKQNAKWKFARFQNDIRTPERRPQWSSTWSRVSDSEVTSEQWLKSTTRCALLWAF
jgi:hypothetical protein